MKKSIGIPVKPPEKECQDERCAWHGSLPVRGMVFRGVVRSAKSKDTAIVEWGYTHLVPKYERYERRKSRVVVHNPECMKARDGDEVVVAECRPLSKTKNFVIVAVPKRKVEMAEFKVAEIEAEAVAKARVEKKEEPAEEKSAEPKKGAEPEKPSEKEKPAKPEKEEEPKPEKTAPKEEKAKKPRKEAAKKPKKPAKKTK